MFDMLNEKIKENNNADTVFQFLIDMLGYKTSSNYHSSKDTDYDAEYVIEIENRSYAIIGIKALKEKDEKKILEQHLKYWNRNDVPFSILIFPDEIRIYNNFTIGKKKILYSSNQKNNKVIELFSDKSIANGLLWEQLNAALKKSDRVDKYFLNNLRNTIIDLYKNYEMGLEDAYNFLAQCIFIKYMEDRKMLTESAFAEYGVENFNELLSLENIEYIKILFVKIKDWFNGDLFDLGNMKWPTQRQLGVIKNFFDAEEIYANGSVQYTLFKYDFSKIPIELISNIYETFFNLDDTLLEKKYSSKNGAFYTPFYLADFMNDSCLKKYPENIIPKVLDPSCGSGVFLVGAFKRLVERKKAQNEVVNPDDLRNILLNNVYGIDLNLKALKLTCFSLYIALLEFLTPKDILKNEFKFPNLIGTTLFCCDFFYEDLNNQKIEADIIIGNPPWISDKVGLHNTYCKKNNIPISDGQIAQSFIVRAKDFVKESGIISLIVTNSIFTNENAAVYREYLLNNFQLFQVFNLYRVRKTLFSHASAPCSILTYGRKLKNNDYSFNYYAFKPNMLSDAFYKIVYDKNEIIKIRSKNVVRNDYVWRVLNNGDEYDVRVINKIKSFPIIKDRDYKYFRGYAVGSKEPKDRPEFKKYKGGNLQEGFGPYLINYNALPQIIQDKFERPRDIEGYLSKNKILIKRTQNEKLSGAAFCEEPIIFTDDYHCLWKKECEDINEFKILSAYYNSSIFKYYRFFASKVASSIKPELSKEDILSFPVPEDIESKNKERIINNVREIEVLLQRQFNNPVFVNDEITEKILNKQREIDEIVFETYNLDDVEQATIKYALDYIVPNSNNEGMEGFIRCDDEVYIEYSTYIERYFDNFLLDSGLTLKRSNIFSKNLFTLITFTISEVNKAAVVLVDEAILENIVDILGISCLENIESELIVKNKLSGFLKQGFFVIKEKERKNWTLMNAIKDADYFAKSILNEEEEEEAYEQ